MSPLGLGCAKTPAVAPHVEISPNNCIAESQIILHTRGSMPCWRIVFSTFCGCMSFYTARVILDRVVGSDACIYVRSTPMCGRLRVGKDFLHVRRIGRCAHVFGLLARFT